jgi:hypothetical protein
MTPEAALRAGGLVVFTLLAAVSAVWEAFLTPLYWHHVRVPLALVLAVLGNAALAWATYELTRRGSAVLLPAFAWVVPMFVAADRTTEGDLVLTSNNWVGLATLFTGALAFGITAYWLIVRSIRRPVPSRDSPEELVKGRRSG